MISRNKEEITTFKLLQFSDLMPQYILQWVQLGTLVWNHENPEGGELTILTLNSKKLQMLMNNQSLG